MARHARAKKIKFGRILGGIAAAVSVGMTFVVGAHAAGATTAPTPPFAQCPQVGRSPSCKILLVIESDGSVSVYGDDSAGDYDGGDDTLVGVVNNFGSSVPAITVTGPGSDLAGFDGDGLCTYISCTWPAPTGYEGPSNTFTTDPNLPDSAEVDFTGAGLASGASTYFSLEGTLTSAVLTARQGTLSGVTIKPTDGVPGTVFSATWQCSNGPGSPSIAATDGQPLPDNSTDITLSLGGDRYSRSFQVDGDGAYQVLVDCNGVTSTAPFTVTTKPYVALGDSYSSGEGASSYYPDTDIKDVDMCHRGIGAWSVPVAIKEHLTRDFAACSGAVIEDINQYNDAYAQPKPPATSDELTPPDELPAGWPEIPQLDHVSRTGATKFVTLSMGGNNVGFPSVITDCIFGLTLHFAGGFGCANRDAAALGTAVGWLTQGRPAGCYPLPGIDPEKFSAEQICSNKPVPALHQMYEQIAKRLPSGGTVAVVGYPKLFGSNLGIDPVAPTGLSCEVGRLGPLSYRISKPDIQWLNAKANTLNDTIAGEVTKAQKELDAAGIHVTIQWIPVDTGAKSLFDTHRICDTGTPYFHGLEFSTIHPQPWSFHPNDDGISAYGNAITTKL